MQEEKTPEIEEHDPDCTCGCHDHDHEHGHDEHHDHHGHHDHDHGPDCTCGCHDHEHEHHDHDGHDHHDHEHAHKHTVELDWAQLEMESHMHNEAATVSATIFAHDSSQRTFAAIVEALQAIAANVEAAGGIVGHIKGYARNADEFAHASATDADHAPASEGDAQLPLGPETQAQLVAIAVLVDLHELEHMVIEALG